MCFCSRYWVESSRFLSADTGLRQAEPVYIPDKNLSGQTRWLGITEDMIVAIDYHEHAL